MKRQPPSFEGGFLLKSKRFVFKMHRKGIQNLLNEYKEQNMKIFECYMTDARSRIDECFEKLENAYSILNDNCSADKSDTPEDIVFILNKLSEIDKYSYYILMTIASIRQFFLLFSKNFELPAITEFIDNINSFVYRYNEYEPMHRKYVKLRETLENKIEAHQ